MKKYDLLVASALVMLPAIPAAAQTATTTSAQATAPTNGPEQELGQPSRSTDASDIVVTAQRQSQRLQDVPIAVSAFTAENLEKQQIVNPTALQQTLPNVTFTKTNFTSSSFTIRGIGDLCVGASCDSATAIHVNDMPLVSTRLFESEFFDLERVEVLRGPQGTLFGRNATSGVVNFITAKPDLSAIHAAGEFEYGNFDSKRVRGMFNLPIGDTLGIRVAGTYLKRDGYTKNLFDGSRLDGRDLYSLRGTLSWEPTSDTRIDLIGYYFHERDDRSRIQKQLCHRDPTGVLGCLPDRLANETTNGNSTLATMYSSREFYASSLGATFAQYALASVYGPDTYAGVINPGDVRTVNVDYKPTYFSEEEQYTAKIFHDFGPVSFNFTGGYARISVDSTTDYNLAVENPLGANVGALTLIGTAAAPGALFPGGINPFTDAVAALFPNRNTGTVCQSNPGPGNGVFSGDALCGPRSQDVDRSKARSRQFSAEAHIDSNFDGMFNFLIGGIYVDQKIRDNSYYVTAFPLDYGAAVIGAANALGTRAAGGTIPNVFASTPFYRSFTDRVHLKSYGLFGETYFAFNDRLKLTLGLRYNHDEKDVRARTSFIFDTRTRTLVDASGTTRRDAEGNAIAVSAVSTALVPYANPGSLENAVNYATLDYDPFTTGNQPFGLANVSFGRLTGRAVLDYQITSDNLLYASYSRGYKSGGVNPPLSPVFAVPQAFAPETVDSFEIGSKNSFLNRTLQLNLTGFYYKYKRLQLSRIVARTAVNDNVNADIYGIEAEAIVRPSRALVVNMNFSYLKSKITSDKFIGNPQDPANGRTDTVIIKDITNASNCAVRPTVAGNAAGANAFVGAVNSAFGLRAPVGVPNTGTTGAFSICDALAAASAGALAVYNPALAALQGPLNAAFGTNGAGALPFVVDRSGVLVNIRGNQLPQAPRYKFSAGVQYTAQFGDGYSIVPRVDLAYTGEFYASIFNRAINRVQGYEVVNAQVQFNAPDDRFYVRGFVQNLTKNNGITGQYVTDQSSGLFTNIFTIEPRRYGLAAGFKF